MRPWTTREEALLRRHYGTRAGADIAALLGRSVPAVRMRARDLGIAARAPRWTAAEDAVLRAEHARGRGYPARVAARLGRSRRAVKQRRRRLGLEPAAPDAGPGRPSSTSGEPNW